MTSIEQAFIEGLTVGVQGLGLIAPILFLVFLVWAYTKAQEALASDRANRISRLMKLLNENIEVRERLSRELNDIERTLDEFSIPKIEEGRLIMSQARRVRVALGAKR